jgi:Ca2+-binding RTX toxin-like protein
MTGGQNADTFYFDAWAIFGEHGADRITDFNVTQDRLRLDGPGSINDLEIAQVGANTVITYDWFEGSITLVGVDMNNLLANAQTAITFG